MIAKANVEAIWRQHDLRPDVSNQGGQRAPGELGGVVGDLDRYIAREHALGAIQRRLDVIGDLDTVGVCLLGDREANRLLAVQALKAGLLGVGIGDRGDVLYADHPLAAGDCGALEVVDRLETRVRANALARGASVKRPPGMLTFSRSSAAWSWLIDTP